MDRLVILSFGWLLYFFLHSMLAQDSLKTLAKELWAVSDRAYRILYVVVSVLGLVTLLFFNSNISAALFFDNVGWVRYLSLMLTAFGVIIIKVSFREYNFEAFLGIKNPVGEAFASGGILSKVRHPIYLGTIIIVLGYFLFSPTLPTLVSMICIFLYIPVGIYFEEKKLIKLYGDKYIRYKQNVPALIPKFF